MNDPSSSPVALDRTAGLAPREPAPAELRLGEVWRRPLPHYRDVPLTRLYCRLIMSLATRQVLGVRGVERIAPDRDPFLFVLNHNQRFEAVLIPTLLLYFRGGRSIHFLADWPFMLMPFVASLYRRSHVIIVAGKEPRIKALKVFQRFFTDQTPALERAAARLRAGSPVGIFPESTVNRDPRNLLRGATGAARLALATGVPVVPAGIRFPRHDPERPIRDGEAMTLEIGDPLAPPKIAADVPTLGEARDFHRDIMQAIARLSGKSWSPKARRRR